MPTDSPSAYSFHETYPKQVTISVIFATLRMSGAFLADMSYSDFTRTSFMLPSRIVSNAGTEFRKIE